MAVVWLILIALFGLAIGIYELKYGLREQSWFWALWGAWGMFGAILVGIVLLGAGIIVLLTSMSEMDPTISVGIVLIVWVMVAFFAFRYRHDLLGKALFVLAVLWSGLLSIPLTVFLRWGTAEALLLTMSLSALALIVWGLIMKQARAARARKDAYYKRVLDEADAREKPPWEK